MERFFVLDKFNTWYDWRFIVTNKNVSPPEPKTQYVEIDGMNGSLDLSEALTGEVVYNDRTVSATFWTDNGTRKDRERLLREITVALHGKRVKIVEPDDPDHYFIGRVTIKSVKNHLAYLELSIEAKCEPWRYACDESNRVVTVLDGQTVNAVIRNEGIKTLSPILSVTDNVTITYGGVATKLSTGTYQMSNLKLYHGVNVVTVSGDGTVVFTYREADL